MANERSHGLDACPQEGKSPRFQDCDLNEGQALEKGSRRLIINPLRHLSLQKSGSEDAFRQNGHSNEHVHNYPMCCKAPYVHVHAVLAKALALNWAYEREGIGPTQKVPKHFLALSPPIPVLKG